MSIFPKKDRCHITSLPPHNDHLSTKVTFLCLKVIVVRRYDCSIFIQYLFGWTFLMRLKTVLSKNIARSWIEMFNRFSTATQMFDWLIDWLIDWFIDSLIHSFILSFIIFSFFFYQLISKEGGGSLPLIQCTYQIVSNIPNSYSLRTPTKKAQNKLETSLLFNLRRANARNLSFTNSLTLMLPSS